MVASIPALFDKSIRDLFQRLADASEARDKDYYASAIASLVDSYKKLGGDMAENQFSDAANAALAEIESETTNEKDNG